MWTADNRPRYNRDKLRYPSDLTDAEWAHIEPLIPPGKPGGGNLPAGKGYSRSKEFLEAGKKRLAGDTGRQATSGEVKGLRQEMRDLKELVAELSLENRLLKKSMIADGGDEE